jgi:FkbM family methyltransferase
MVRLGSSYGGWWVPRSLLAADSVCYLAGVGEDVTFDLALIDAVGCEVWAIDPTPRAIAYAETVENPKFHLLPLGIWSEDAELKFFEPSNPAHVSHSAVNAQGTERFFVASCRSIRTFMNDLGHDHVDLLKLDIEGAEVAVIEDILSNGPLPKVFCVEFDAPEPLRATLGRVRRLRAAGYEPTKVEGLNVTFVLQA